jgi:hypothetical protein
LARRENANFGSAQLVERPASAAECWFAVDIGSRRDVILTPRADVNFKKKKCYFWDSHFACSFQVIWSGLGEC